MTSSLKTVTGRWSSKHPHFTEVETQNIPVRTEEGKAVLDALRPAPPDIDFSATEMHLLVLYGIPVVR